MKNLIFPFLISFVLSGEIHAQFIIENKYGFMSNFKVGRFENDTTYQNFVLDSINKVILPAKSEFRYLPPDNNQRVPIYSNQLKLGTVDFSGKIRLGTAFYAISTPLPTDSGNFYWVISRIDTIHKITNPKERFLLLKERGTIKIKEDSTQAYWGVIGENGKWLIMPRLKEIGSFEGGKFLFKDERGWSIVDVSGIQVHNPLWEAVYFLGENTFVYKKGGKYGLLNKEGKILTPPIWIEFSRNVCHYAIGVINKNGVNPFWDTDLVAQEYFEVSIIDLKENKVIDNQHLGNLDLHYFDCSTDKLNLREASPNKKKAQQIERVYYLLSVGERELNDGNKPPNYYELEITPYVANNVNLDADVLVDTLFTVDTYDLLYQKTDRGYNRTGWGSSGFGEAINTETVFVDEHIISFRLSRLVHSGCESYDRYLSVNYFPNDKGKMEIVRLDMHLNNAKAFGHAIQKALKDSNNALWKENGNEKSLWEYEGRFNITDKGIQVYYGAAMFEMNESVFIKFSDIKRIIKKGSFLNKYI